MKKKLIRLTTIPLSLDKLLEGQLSFMNNFYNVIAVSSDKEYLKKIGDRENVEVFPVEMTRKITPIKDLIAVYKLFTYFRKEKPFIVHTHTPKAGTVGMIAAKLAGVPNRLHTIAGLPLLEANGFKRKILNIVEKITYSCATKVYPNSKVLKEIIIKEKFCNANKLKVIANGSSNGINTNYFNTEHFTEEEKNKLKKELNILPTDFVFIFVGRLVKDKGINELISAFKSLQEKTPNIKLLLVGSFESELDPLETNTVNEIEINKDIISVGYKKDVRLYFAISNALVFPNVVMQAGAMELPCIVTNINGCNEIITKNKNGIIIQVKDQEAIYKAMNTLLQDKKLFNSLKCNAREMIVSRYEQKVVWNAILEEYKLLEQNV